MLKKLLGDDELVALSLSQRDVERAALEVDDRVDFRADAAPRATERVDFDPPFPPDAS